MALKDMTTTSENTYEEWGKLSPELIIGMPQTDQQSIINKVRLLGRKRMAESRITEFNSVRSNRLPENKKALSKMIVTLVGALTLSIAPQLIAQQTGRGPMAISIGFIGGGVASFFAHNSAKKVLVGIKLKHRYRQARANIK